MTVPAALRLELRPPPEALEIAKRVIAHEHDVAAPPAVAAVGTAPRDVGLVAQAQAAVAAAAGD